MASEEQTTQEQLPYVKPTVERIPLSDARNGPFNPNGNDGILTSS